MGGERRNMELKARDRNPKRSLGICEDLGAEDRGMLFQRDTYFAVPRGRLKLRQEKAAASHLIAYERPDTTGHKESRYRIVEVGEASELKEALAGGSFIEFEGVVEAGDEDLRRFEALLADLRRSFGIGDVDLIGESYCDLVAKKLRSACNT